MLEPRDGGSKSSNSIEWMIVVPFGLFLFCGVTFQVVVTIAPHLLE